MAEFVAIVVLAAALTAGAAWLARTLPRVLDRRLGGFEERVERRLGDVETKVDRRLDGLDTRLLSSQQAAGQAAGQIAEQLGRLGGTAAQLHERVNDLRRLEQALRPPKARGGFGELLLGNLLRDMLPPEAYQLQYTFRSGDRVDAVIKVDKLVPVDAKFPLENYERLVNAADEAEQALAERAFRRDVKNHVDDIAGKYVRPAENTYDFALMYLPSESIYYELVCGKNRDFYAYALDRRVFAVSPTLFHAYLRVIALGLKGMQIERHAKDVMAYCAQLSGDFDRFRGDFEVVGKHIANAYTKYGEADRRLERFGVSLERAAEWEAAPGDAPADLPRALDAA